MHKMESDRIDKNKYIYLTTMGRRTGRPRTVELWFAIVCGENIYLSHEGEPTDWMKNILKNSKIRFRIGGDQYRGKARIVEDEGSFEKGKHALYLKYYGKAGDDVIDDWFSGSKIVEISEIERQE
jgi:deazaflavin-dependent oxidoreductase (nitroreductase family)